MNILDNISHRLGDDLRTNLQRGARLKIAASTFSIYAFEALKAELSKIDSLQFVFTAPTFIPDEASDRLRKEHREFYIPKSRRESGLYGTEFEIQLRNKLTQRAVARECADWIRKKASFRSNASKASMQQFIHVSGAEDEVTYMPISGFTAVDLGYQKGDAVSNLVSRFDDPAQAKVYLELFNSIWSDPEKVKDVTEAICEHIETVYKENSPERIYFLMLYNIFKDFLEEVDDDVLPNDRTGYQESEVWTKLFNYQRDAAKGIINKLETYNGCILADSVGLGKTFTALAVIKYYELRNRSVLVLCPKKLADNWLNYNSNLTTNIFAKDRFNYDVLCHTDLSRTSGESFGIPLNRVNWGNYDLIVIDESHNFRNNDVFKDRETRYQKLMNQVIRAGVRTKVLMLSATPVNNRFSDLRNQLALAYEGHSDALSSNLKTQASIEEIFRRAQKAFNGWSSLPPEERTAASILRALDFDFFELLDAVSIARSRKHIETFYDTTDIGKFPQRRKPLSYHRPITERPDVMGFNDIFAQLSVLKLAVYAPISYILPSRLRKYEEIYDTQVEGGRGKLKQADRERSLQALMTTNLLKRLESSVAAFRITLQSLAANISRTLEAIDGFEKTGRSESVSDYLGEIINSDQDDDDLSGLDEFTVGKKIQISLADMDLPSWKHDLAADLALIENLITSMEKVGPSDDAKLQHLLDLIRRKVDQPLNDGNRKVLIFTAFADTANYLFENLAPFAHQVGLEVGKVTGSDTPKTTLKKPYDFQSVLTLFSPRSKEKDKVLPNEPSELDILIGTDCISEGQNLQDCDFLINYDIHWNPVRIIQRFGRIDRIGSLNDEIQLVNYWPDITLDEYINLKERVENRMVISDISATGDDNVLTAKSSDIAYRKEQLKRLQDEVIELEGVKTGISITDLGLNDFRMDLLNYVKEHGELDKVPFGMHAVVPARPDVGLVPGVIFVLRNIHDGLNVNQQNRLHPFYLVYIDNEGEIVADHTEVKRLLDLIRTSCKGRNEPIAEVCRIFNELTHDGSEMTHHSELLATAIGSMIKVKEEKDIDSLFSGGRTTALNHTIKGLDDFELIAFLVVQKPDTGVNGEGGPNE
ncbi:DEAD/DEAH box helicase family protein [Nitratireductor aquimarinus]|uniref:helicase-related protein n=1 Tax=Nitratireductor TaxID=245876 RepID=UPI0019D37DF6|nr:MULTISPECIES: helicase-related protein [Nitratireductor]MBN7775934.1 DEAD/DEAH box helicase family protein [Nitratireductor pacificus]MBN7780597.1 DEAD/DEAH box helicase family protein [Nitratireductor pacificus]MBN7789404.1 DEAD/DEAH box helicase family protein [Nitratireductor aquimarinus]MBY6098682.1 DEAD/DEAH box helicase family protein [Nitratireductor aquimarinus]MCA1259568.1 DEAD/DEAH box helicase family protein [Nitratireductor aquimarinus]